MICHSKYKTPFRDLYIKTSSIILLEVFFIFTTLILLNLYYILNLGYLFNYSVLYFNTILG